MEALALLMLFLSISSGQDVADCSWKPDAENSELNCHLKTLQTGPAVIPQVQNANTLSMRCSDIYLYESVMHPDQFGTLSQLHELRIEFCKIKLLPAGAFVGLRNLRTLVLQGHNSEWSGSMTMQLQPDTLKNLDKLETVDLADNNIWGLPTGSLCHTPILRTLNLSRNNIVEVSEIGLTEGQNPRDGCQLLHLKTLDLSYNKISSFLPQDLSLAPGLQSLNLRGNRLSVLSDQSLTGLWSLSVLDLSDNHLAALPPTIFHQSNNLQKLFLQNNSLSLLSPDLLSGLDNLLLLNLSRNDISSHLLSESIFSGLTKLVALDMSHNSLTKLHADLLKEQQSLQILNLQYNLLANIAPNCLSSLLNLHILLLSHNHLTELPQTSFASLASLNSLSLDHNRLNLLPAGLFAGSPHLQDLALNNNYLDQVPADIGSLARLRTLDLGENRIQSVSSQQLEKLNNLYGLRLAGNQLSDIDIDVFTNNTNLHVLNIAHNKISNIHQDAFKHLKNLRALRLDNNELKDINGLVSSQKNLKWLNVSTNQLQWFDFAFIPKSLEWLDIHNNKIDKIGNYYSLSSGFNLQTFDTSYNQIKEIEDNTLLSGLKNIYLNNNKIQKIAPESFQSLGNLTRVELQGNELVSMQIDALATSQTALVPEFLLGGNPWLCDCTMEWLKSINQKSSNGGYPRIMDLDAVMCGINGARNSSLVPVLRMESNQFMCQYEAHCIPQCFCCDFFACDCRMQCPEGCACYHDNLWSNNIIQCSLRGHADVPPLIPMDATSVYLDGNNMTELVNPGFIGRRRIRTVYLNSSMIRKVTNFSLEGLTEVRVLHLEDNQIEELAGNEFAGLTMLAELFLQNNYLTTIGAETFSTLKGLTVLRLDGNLLSNFPAWELINNPMMIGVYLAGNMWSCDCEFLRPFLAYQRKLGSKVIDRNDLKCVADHFRGEAITQMENVICGDHVIPDFQSSNVTPLDYTPILVSVLLAVLMIVIGYLLAFTFRTSIKEWLYSKTNYSSGNKNNTIYSGKDKLFDVFISYSVEDRDFVEQSFAPNLEHGTTSYRLCLHQRDFPPTTPVFDTVSVAVESSARALVVLSRSYLSTQWSQIRTPFINSIMTNNTKVVFIQLDDVSSEEISTYQDFKHLLDDSPLVKWGDPGFWNKLRYFLPEPVYLTFHRNVTMRGTLQSSNLYQSVLGNQVGELQHPFGSCSGEPNTATSVEPKCDHGYQPGQQPSIYSMDHTYHSIDNNHIYHTLDPGGSTQNLYLQFQSNSQHIPNRVYINGNLDLVSKLPLPSAHPQVSTIPGHALAFPRPLPAPISNQNQTINSNQPQLTHSTATSPQPTINHNHTNSTSSAKRLLSPEDSEYIV